MLKNRRCNSQSQLNDINYQKNIGNYLNNENNYISKRNNNIINANRYYSPQQNLYKFKNNSCNNRANYNIINNTDGTDDYYINYL